MKAKLIKENGKYYLDGDNLPNPRRLNLDNCDEIFGVINVEKLAEEKFRLLELTNHISDSYVGEENNQLLGHRKTYIKGFNKAMELNKDKLFTVEDIKKAIEMARKGSIQEQHNGYGQRTSPIFVSDNLSVDTIIQSLQQPTEIEVEVVMGTLCRQIDCVDDARLIESKIVWDKEDPILDENGCLILKKL